MELSTGVLLLGRCRRRGPFAFSAFLLVLLATLTILTTLAILVRADLSKKKLRVSMLSDDGYPTKKIIKQLVS